MIRIKSLKTIPFLAYSTIKQIQFTFFPLILLGVVQSTRNLAPIWCIEFDQEKILV